MRGKIGSNLAMAAHYICVAPEGTPFIHPTPLSMEGFTALDELVNIITSGVASIKCAYVAAGATAPNIDKPWTASDIEQETSALAVLVSAAAFQLASTLRNPNTVMWEATSGVRPCIAAVSAGY